MAKSTELHVLTRQRSISTWRWRLNLAGLSAPSPQAAYRKSIKGGGVTCQHTGLWARFIHVDRRCFDLPSNCDNQGAGWLRDMRRCPKNSLCFLAQCFVGPVSSCDSEPAHSFGVFFFLHRRRHLRFLCNVNRRMSRRRRGVHKTKTRGAIFEKKKKRGEQGG